MDLAPHRHATHPNIVKRLKRADGHLQSVIEMIETGRPCLEISQQLHAVERAIAQAKKTLITIISTIALTLRSRSPVPVVRV